jgi:hypothetical protein
MDRLNWSAAERQGGHHGSQAWFGYGRHVGCGCAVGGLRCRPEHPDDVGPVCPGRPWGRQAQHASRLATQREIRAVYTEEQPTAIIAKLQAQPEPVARDGAGKVGDRPDMAAKLAETLQLSDAQKAAIEALKPAEPAVRPGHAAHRQAEIAFWQTGDTTQLQALAPAFVDMTDAIVTAATTLTVDQRKAVFSHGFGGPGLGGPGMGDHRMGGQGMGGPGGKGPGGKSPGGKGPGGRPGMGGHDMGRGPGGIGGGFDLPV